MRVLILAVAIFLSILPVGDAAVERFAVQAGTRWETSGCIADSGQTGPVALILGGVHGNEPAGAAAAEKVCGFSPVMGKIVVVARINPLGLKENVRYLPELGDMNRAYPPGAENTPADQMGAEIIRLMERQRIAMLIDLHEARTFHRIDRTSLGQTLLFADNPASTVLAMDTVEAVNRDISDDIRKFALVGNPIPHSSAWYAGKYLGIAAFTVETSSQQPFEDRIRQHLAIVRELLTAGGWLQP
jgi:predicted deacylase